MIRIRTAAAVSAAALLGVAVLAGCSSSDSTSDSTSEKSAAASGSAQLPAPVIVAEDATTATCSVGTFLDIVIPEDALTATTVASSDEAIVSVTQPSVDGDAMFNAGGECLTAGEATVTVTNPDGSTRDIAVTVSE